MTTTTLQTPENQSHTGEALRTGRIVEIQGFHLRVDEILLCEKRYHAKSGGSYLWIRFKNNLINTFNYVSEQRMLKDYKKIVSALDRLETLQTCST